MPKKMTREEVIKTFDQFLDMVIDREDIHKPYAWAVYQTWLVVGKYEQGNKKKWSGRQAYRW